MGVPAALGIGVIEVQMVKVRGGPAAVEVALAGLCRVPHKALITL